MSRFNIGVFVLTIVGTVGAFGVLAPASAFAAKGGGGHAGKGNVVFGSVASVAATSFDVTTSTGTVTVNFTDKTKFRPLSDAATAAGFVAGDAVAALIPKDDTTNTARGVAYDTAPFPVHGAKQPVRGIYASNDATSVTVTLRKGGGTATINVNANTKYREDGQDVTSPTYEANDRIMAVSVSYTDGSTVARRVGIHTPKAKG